MESITNNAVEEAFSAQMSTFGVSATGAVGGGQGLSADMVEQLTEHLRMIQGWNERVDLVGSASSEILLAKHFLDAVSAYHLMHLELKESPPGSYLDIGSGAGFPGLVIAILEPEKPMYLCEPRLKRATFLKEVKRVLALKNVTVLNNRVEDIDQKEVEALGCIMTRAVGEEELIRRICRKLLSKNGCLVEFVGPSWREPQEPTEGLELSNVLNYTLPPDNAPRKLAIWKVFHVKHFG